MRGRRWDWRYAAAGLGWGAAVGALTGGLLAWVTIVESFVLDDSYGSLGALAFLLPLLGALYGVLPGALIGLAAGVATAWTAGGVTPPRRATWTAFVTSLVAGCAAGAGLGIAVGGFTLPISVWPIAVILVAAALGAGLIARTARSLAADPGR